MRQQSLFDQPRPARMAPARPSFPASLSFDSWSSWVDHCERCVHPKGAARAVDGGPSWAGGVDFDGALHLARDGWPEGTRRAEKQTMTLADKLAPQLVRDEYRFERAPGVCFDMSRVLTGDPDCWIEPYETHVAGPGRPLVLVVSGNASAAVSSETIMRRGATLAAFAILLERAGRACEIVLSMCARGDSLTAVDLVTLKHAGQPLNVDVATFALGHPATLRRLSFASLEGRTEAICRDVGVKPYAGGYGHPADAPADNRGDVYVGVHGDWASPESAEAWLRATLKQQGAIA